MRTAGEIAQRALIRAGVIASGETPTAAEINDAVTTLADMVDSWSLEHLTVYGPATVVVPLAGQQSFTVGPSGSVVAERPNAVVSAFARIGGVDHPVRQASPAFMGGISNKAVPCDARWMSYEGTMPNATFQIWPAQQDGELHLTLTQPVVKIANAYDELDLPPGWWHAMTHNLAVHLCEEYGFPVTDALATLAMGAKANIKRANLQPATTSFDRALL